MKKQKYIVNSTYNFLNLQIKNNPSTKTNGIMPNLKEYQEAQ